MRSLYFVELITCSAGHCQDVPHAGRRTHKSAREYMTIVSYILQSIYHKAHFASFTGQLKTLLKSAAFSKGPSIRLSAGLCASLKTCFNKASLRIFSHQELP